MLRVCHLLNHLQPCFSNSAQDCSYSPHHSWSSSDGDVSLNSTLDSLRQKRKLDSKFVCGYQQNYIAVYDASKIDFTNNDVKNDMYNQFFNECGAIIIKNGYCKSTMDSYNRWCENFLEIAKKTDVNIRHPKQAGKYLINDVMLRLSKHNPSLLFKLINSHPFIKTCDILLGFSKFGSLTTHWIEPGGDRQQSHVDYPMHVGSGPFWEHDTTKLQRMVTKYQLNQILPYYSIQVLIASDKMDESNGSTELVPCSHLIPNIDILIHDKKFQNQIEPYFVNVSLNQGDILFFNRRLCHRGGKNKSNTRRNSLIAQCVWLWSIGQEIMETDNIINNLKKCDEYMKMTSKEKEMFRLRLEAPYPKNVKLST